MSPRDWRLFVDDILEAITKINRYTRGTAFTDFSQDERTIDAVVRNLEIIGEAARRIPDDVKAESQDIDWKAIHGLRNRIAHEYSGLSLTIIWEIIQSDLPVLDRMLRQRFEIPPMVEPRAGWAKAAAASPPEGLLDDPSTSRFDDEEWST